jgi:hypothetical protein
MSKASFQCYPKAYVTGGLGQLKQIDYDRPQSKLTPYRSTLKAYIREHPPAMLGDVVAKITGLTGVARRPTQVRQSLNAHGMKPHTVGMLPAKADVNAQAACMEPRKAEAQVGQRAVFFMDAAHIVFAPFVGIVRCVQRLFVKAPSGCQRLNVLTALNGISHELFTVENLTYITAETV